MFSFNYDIELTEEGRPYISPVGETKNEMNIVEHKFLGLELARSIISSTIDLHELDPIKKPLPEEELLRLKKLEYEISRISNIFAITIKEQFELMGFADRILNKNFDISVYTEKERDDLKYIGNIFDNKTYDRKIGLKVKVLRTGDIFELVDGIDNIHWTKI